MPALFTLPQVVGLSATNQLLPGAKLYFRISGTSTPQPTYQDIALTVSHANPVIADGAGVFDPIYLDPSLPDYRVILADSADVTQPGYPIDNYPSNQNAGQTFRLTGTAPELVFEQTNATAGNKKWRIRVDSERMRIALLSDAESVATDIAIFDRSGTVSDEITLSATTVSIDGTLDVTGLATLAALTATGALTLNGALTTSNTAANQVGFKGVPQVSGNSAYNIVLADASRHIFHAGADGARTWTIPAEGSINFPIGSMLTFINQNGGGDITIAITTDTMRLAGAGTTGSRTLTANGIATAIKISPGEWLITGTNLS